MKWTLDLKKMNEAFLEKVEKISGQSVSSCYQCGKCSAGCPICNDMDMAPNQIIRLLQFGIKDKALKSKTIWLCASCQTCSIRCPQKIDLAKIMDALRIISQMEERHVADDLRGLFRELGKRLKDSFIYIMQMDIRSNLKCFNQIFLDNIYYYGRIFEPGLIYNYNINSGYLFSNLFKAPVMLLKSKIKFLPDEVKRVERVQKIFDRIKEMEEGEKL